MLACASWLSLRGDDRKSRQVRASKKTVGVWEGKKAPSQTPAVFRSTSLTHFFDRIHGPRAWHRVAAHVQAKAPIDMYLLGAN